MLTKVWKTHPTETKLELIELFGILCIEKPDDACNKTSALLFSNLEQMWISENIAVAPKSLQLWNDSDFMRIMRLHVAFSEG